MSYWAKTYGPGVAKAVALDKNGDIIVVGERGGDAFVARLDRDGNVKWQKTYGGSDDDEAYAVALASNGDVIVAGYTDSFGAGGKDTWVLRLDSEGNVKWQKTYGGKYWDEAHAVALAPNGDVIVAGWTRSFGAGKRDVWVLRLDANGNVKWQKTYGGSDWDVANAVAIAPNGDVIVAGYTDSFGAGGRDAWVLRLDGEGNVKWQKTYGGSDWDEADAVALAPNGDVIVAGWTDSFGAGKSDVWVLRLDENGNVKWQKTYGGSDWDEANAVALAPNGDIIVAGYYGATRRHGSGDNAWVLRLPPDGNLPGCDFCNESNAKVINTNAEIHNTNCEVLSGVRKYEVEVVEGGFLFKKKRKEKRKEWRTERVSLKVEDSNAYIRAITPSIQTQCYAKSEEERRIERQLLSAITISLPALTEGIEAPLKLTLTNNLADSLKATLDLLGNEFFELEETKVEFPELKRRKKVTKTITVTPKYAGAFDLRIGIKAIVNGLEIEAEKVIPVEVAERTATPAYATPQTPVTPATPQTPAYTPTPSTPAPAASELPPGFPPQLAYKYTEIEPIGRGGFARVFKAKRKDGKVVAVKIPLSLDENTGKAFLREISHWLQLKHPNIVRLYDANILPIPFLEMEYCEGSLEKLPKPLPVEVASYIVFNIAEGLKYAHSKGIIHRDLKPSNVLLKEGIPKISDWGLSKAMTETHSTTMASFTPFYASPEQTSRRFGKPDHRSDIWQLGVLFYQLVTGKLPFEGDDLIEVVSRIATDEPVPPGELNPEAKEIEHVILTCLQKNPDDRYQSVAELQLELATYLGLRYKKELKRSITVNDTPRAAFYAGKLMLMFLKMGNMKEAYKYASDLKFYASGELSRDVEELAEGIKVRLEEGLSFAGEELLAKAEIIAHKVSLGFEKL